MSSDEILRLYKILKSSNRIQEVRDLFGLKKGEFIISFNPPHGTITTRSGGKSRKVSSDSRGDVVLFSTDVQKFLEKNIIEYFGLNIDLQTVENAIFFNKNFVPRSFSMHSSIAKDSGRFKVCVEFFEYPNAKTRKAIITDLDKELRLLKEMFRTKNTKGMSTIDASYSQIKKISKFDAKFEITKRYKEIQKKMKNGTSKNLELQKLRIEAAKIYKKSGMTLDDIRKEIYDFEKNFGEIEVQSIGNF